MGTPPPSNNSSGKVFKFWVSGFALAFLDKTSVGVFVDKAVNAFLLAASKLWGPTPSAIVTKIGIPDASRKATAIFLFASFAIALAKVSPLMAPYCVRLSRVCESFLKSEVGIWDWATKKKEWHKKVIRIDFILFFLTKLAYANSGNIDLSQRFII